MANWTKRRHLQVLRASVSIGKDQSLQSVQHVNFLLAKQNTICHWPQKPESENTLTKTVWHYTCSLRRRRAAVATQTLTSLSGWFKKQWTAFSRLVQLQFSTENPQYPSAWRIMFIISKDSQNQFRNQSKNKLLSLQFLILVVWLFNLGPHC